MTGQPGNERRERDLEHLVDGPAAQPACHGPAGLGSSPATAATVGLATAARVLGINPAAAQTLAEHDEFPCNVIRTTDGYRVTFASLVRILRRVVASDLSQGQDPAQQSRKGNPQCPHPRKKPPA